MKDDRSVDLFSMRRVSSDRDVIFSIVGKVDGMEGSRASISSSETSKFGFGFCFFSFLGVGRQLRVESASLPVVSIAADVVVDVVDGGVGVFERSVRFF